MATYNGITMGQVVNILTNIANGIAAISGNHQVLSDLAIDFGTMRRHFCNEDNDRDFYLAFRETGVESGTKEKCYDRCKNLGYPLVIVKVTQHLFITTDYDVTITLTRHRTSGDYNLMEQEFNIL
jgi:hypothetical protein